MAMTIASADVAGALAEAWQAFRDAAHDDPAAGTWPARRPRSNLRNRDPVPPLFRQTLISSGKRRTTTSNEIAGQITYPQVRQLLSEVRDVLQRGLLSATAQVLALAAFLLRNAELGDLRHVRIF
jgi:hypothetical protein